MRGVICSAILVFALTATGETLDSRVIQPTTIEQFPFVAALLRSADGIFNFQHRCGGSILNNRAVLTAGNCVYNDSPNRWRFRVGSSSHNSGGTVYPVTFIALNNFDEWSMGWDIAIVRTSTAIVPSANVQPGRFAGANYNLADNQLVSTAGWGSISMPIWNPGQFEEIRQHQQWTLDVEVCRYHYLPYGLYVQPFQICSGFLDPAQLGSGNAIDKCFGEPGAPLVHNGVVVGIRSFAVGCSRAEVPTVSTRVSSFINWISETA